VTLLRGFARTLVLAWVCPDGQRAWASYLADIGPGLPALSNALTSTGS
jgi:hypothetical protein